VHLTNSETYPSIILTGDKMSQNGRL